LQTIEVLFIIKSFSQNMLKPFYRTILLTGLMVGTADIIAAHIHQFIKTGQFPNKMLQYIAGGALGLENSLDGGFGIQLLGLTFHYIIAFSFTILFFVLFQRLHLAKYNKYFVGFLYGPLIGVIMSFVVLPLTKLPNRPFVFQNAIVGWFILSIAIGIPCSIIASKYYSDQSTN
jgi:hypothetical protein